MESVLEGEYIMIGLRKIRKTAVILACATAAGLGVAVAAAGPSQAAPSHAASASFTCLKNVYIHTSNGQYLDVKGSGGSQTPVITWYYNGAPNQLWCIEAASEGGYYLHPNNNVTGLCLDVPFSNAQQGTLIWVFNCNGTKAQRWAMSIYSGSTTIRPELNTAVGLQANGFGYQVYLNYGGGSTWYFR